MNTKYYDKNGTEYPTYPVTVTVDNDWSTLPINDQQTYDFCINTLVSEGHDITINQE